MDMRPTYAHAPAPSLMPSIGPALMKMNESPVKNMPATMPGIVRRRRLRRPVWSMRRRAMMVQRLALWHIGELFVLNVMIKDAQV